MSGYIQISLAICRSRMEQSECFSLNNSIRKSLKLLNLNLRRNEK
jgi:hypothetical protein